MFFIDILQTPGGRRQICSACIGPTSTPLATDVLYVHSSVYVVLYICIENVTLRSHIQMQTEYFAEMCI